MTEEEEIYCNLRKNWASAFNHTKGELISVPGTGRMSSKSLEDITAPHCFFMIEFEPEVCDIIHEWTRCCQHNVYNHPWTGRNYGISLIDCFVDIRTEQYSLYGARPHHFSGIHLYPVLTATFGVNGYVIHDESTEKKKTQKTDVTHESLAMLELQA